MGTCTNQWRKDNPERTKEHHKRYRDKRRAFLDALKDRPCVDCGIQYPPHVMDFDHRNSETKTKVLAHMVYMNHEAVLKEAAKCDVVCSNCHRVRTYERRNRI